MRKVSPLMVYMGRNLISKTYRTTEGISHLDETRAKGVPCSPIEFTVLAQNDFQDRTWKSHRIL